MRVSQKHKNASISTDRKLFLTRTALDTVTSFKLEGIIISLDEAYKMAEEIAAKAEKEGKLILA